MAAIIEGMFCIAEWPRELSLDTYLNRTSGDIRNFTGEESVFFNDPECHRRLLVMKERYEGNLINYGLRF